MASSEDGRVWSVNALMRPILAIACGPTMLVGVGMEAYTSTTGSNWVQTTPITENSFGSIAFGNGTFVSMGRVSSSPGNPYTTIDGTHWTEGQTPGRAFRWGTVCFAHDTFILAGDTGVIFTSSTGSNWVERVPGDFYDVGMAYVTHAHGRAIIVGVRGVVLVSDHYGPPILTVGNTAGGAEVNLSVSAEKDKVGAIQVSNDFQNWAELKRFTNSTGVVAFNLASHTNAVELFRAVTE